MDDKTRIKVGDIIFRVWEEVEVGAWLLGFLEGRGGNGGREGWKEKVGKRLEKVAFSKLFSFSFGEMLWFFGGGGMG